MIRISKHSTKFINKQKFKNFDLFLKEYREKNKVI